MKQEFRLVSRQSACRPIIFFPPFMCFSPTSSDNDASHLRNILTIKGMN